MSSLEKSAWNLIAVVRTTYRISQFFVEFSISRKKIFFCKFSGTGQLLHDLEEKMEVARVQLQVLDTLNGLRGHVQEAEAAISQLNSDLIDLTQLYSGIYLCLNIMETHNRSS